MEYYSTSTGGTTASMPASQFYWQEIPTNDSTLRRWYNSMTGEHRQERSPTSLADYQQAAGIPPTKTKSRPSNLLLLCAL